MSDKVYVGARNVMLKIRMNEDVSEATLVRLDVRKPGGTEVQWFAGVTENLFLRYVIPIVDEAGKYYVHPWLEIGDWAGYGTPANFTIHNKWR